MVHSIQMHIAVAFLIKVIADKYGIDLSIAARWFERDSLMNPGEHGFRFSTMDETMARVRRFEQACEAGAVTLDEGT